MGTDTALQGNWLGIYGTDGYQTASDATDVPSSVAASATGASTWTWADASGDVRALERAQGGGRVAAAWYGPTFTFDLSFTDGATHEVSLYVVDWDSFGRAQRFVIRNAQDGSILDARTAVSFSGGQYWRWALQGHVTVEVTQVEGGGGAVVSGIFFDSAPARMIVTQ